MPLHGTLVIGRRGILPCPRNATYTRILLTNRGNNIKTTAIFTNVNFTTVFGFVVSNLGTTSNRISCAVGKFGNAVNARVCPTLVDIKCVYNTGVSSCVFTNDFLD